MSTYYINTVLQYSTTMVKQCAKTTIIRIYGQKLTQSSRVFLEKLNSLASYDIPNILGNPNFHFQLQKSSPLD